MQIEQIQCDKNPLHEYIQRARLEIQYDIQANKRKYRDESDLGKLAKRLAESYLLTRLETDSNKKPYDEKEGANTLKVFLPIKPKKKNNTIASLKCSRQIINLRMSLEDNSLVSHSPILFGQNRDSVIEKALHKLNKTIKFKNMDVEKTNSDLITDTRYYLERLL